MWRSIKDQAKLEVCDMGIYLAVEAGLCALGIVVMVFVHMFSNEASYFPIGSMIAALAEGYLVWAWDSMWQSAWAGQENFICRLLLSCILY